LVGTAVGVLVGLSVAALGLLDRLGAFDGMPLGCIEGTKERLGDPLGLVDGKPLGLFDGNSLG